MKINLDTPSPEMDQSLQDEMGVNNLKKLRQTINKTGCNVLKDIKLNRATTLAIAATATRIQSFEAVITTSGGLIDLDFYTTAEIGMGVSVSFYLNVDDAVVASCGAANPNAATAMSMSMKHSVALGAGRHRVYITYKTNGAFPISYNSLDTRLLAKETLL